MLLNVMERVQLLGLLPAEGNIVTLRIVQDLKQNLSFSEQEIADWGIVQHETTMTWNAEKSQDKEVEIGEAARGVITETLKALDEQKKLTEQQIGLYDKFMT